MNHLRWQPSRAPPASIATRRVAAYSLLLLAANCWGAETIPTEPAPPKWRRRLKAQRPSTNLLLNHLRYEVLSLGYWLEGWGTSRRT